MRWRQLAGILRDCRAVLASAAGDKPIEALRAAGIRVGVIDGVIERVLETVYQGGDLSIYRRTGSCGGCSGNAKGCA